MRKPAEETIPEELYLIEYDEYICLDQNIDLKCYL